MKSDFKDGRITHLCIYFIIFQNHYLITIRKKDRKKERQGKKIKIDCRIFILGTHQDNSFTEADKLDPQTFLGFKLTCLI